MNKIKEINHYNHKNVVSMIMPNQTINKIEEINSNNNYFNNNYNSSNNNNNIHKWGEDKS